MSTAVGAVVALDPDDRQDAVVRQRCRRARTGRARRAAAPRGASPTGPTARDARIVTNVGANLVALNAKTGKRYADFGENGQVDLTQGLRAADHRLALEQRTARRQGRHRRRPASRRRQPTSSTSARARRRRCRPTMSAATTCAPASCCGRSTSCRARASSATTRGSTTRGPTPATAAPGRCISADEELGYVYLPFEEATGDYYGGTRPGNNLFAESDRRASTRRPASASGTSRPCITVSGTTTFPPRRSSPTSPSTAAASRRSRRCRSRRSSTCSIA